MSYTYEYPRPALTVDCAVFALDDGALKVLLIKRGLAPFRGQWALPGGFVDMMETTESAARRELQEETGVTGQGVHELGVFCGVDRDPRERVVSVAYYALTRMDDVAVKAGDDAAEAEWFDVRNVPELAFDHADILAAALRRIESGSWTSCAMSGLLPDEFTMAELRRAYELVSGKPANSRNFRRKMLSTGMVERQTKQVGGLPHRPPSLFRFTKP